MNNQVRLVFYYTSSEAQKAIRTAKTGTKFYVHVKVDLPVLSEPDSYYPGYSWVKLTRKEAQKFVESLLSPVLEARGARIKLSMTLDTVWID
jgi:hypothetical protein